MITRLFASLIVIFSVYSTLNAQDLKQLIPNDAYFLIEINPQLLNQQMSFADMKELAFMKSMIEELEAMSPDAARALEDPTSIGVAGMKPMYVYGTIDDEGALGTNMLISLQDASKFENFMTSMKMKPESNPSISGGGDVKWIENDGMVLSWKPDVLLMSTVYKQPDYNYDYDYEYEENEWEEGDEEWEENEDEEEDEEDKEMGMDEEEEGMNYLEYAMNSLTYRGSSVATNANYIDSRKKDAQIGFWMDYSAFGKFQEQFTGSMDMYGAELSQMMDKIYTMYDGMYLSGSLNYNDGESVMDMTYTMNERTADFAKQATKNKLNKKFFEHIDGESLVGYMSMAYDTEGFIEGIYEWYKPLLKDIPMVGEMSDDALSVLGIFLDEDAIYDIMEGDALVAFNGVTKMEKEVTLYDDEFYPYQDTVMTSVPLMTLMFTTADKDNFNKIIDLGKSAKMLSPSAGSNTFDIVLPYGEPMGADVKMAMKDDVVFFSTDPNFSLKEISTANRMPKKMQKSIRKSPMSMYMNVDKVINTSMEYFADDASMAMGIGMVSNTIQDTMDDMLMTYGKVKGNKMDMKLAFNFKDKQTNSLKQWMLLINELYLSTLSGI